MKPDFALRPLKTSLLERPETSGIYTATCDKLTLVDALAMRKTLRNAFAIHHLTPIDDGLIDNSNANETQIIFYFPAPQYWNVDIAATDIQLAAQASRAMTLDELRGLSRTASTKSRSPG